MTCTVCPRNAVWANNVGGMVCAHHKHLLEGVKVSLNDSNEIITEDYINNVLTSAGTTVPLNADDNAHVVAKVTGYIRALYVEHLGEFAERDIIEYAVDCAQDIIADTPEIVLPEHADIIVDTYLELSKVANKVVVQRALTRDPLNLAPLQLVVGHVCVKWSGFIAKVTDLDERSSETATSPKKIVEIAEYYLASADSY